MPKCGRKTALGDVCTRFVVEPGPCWQHRGAPLAAVEEEEEVPVLSIAQTNGDTAMFEVKPRLIVQAYRCPACGHLAEVSS